MRGLLHRHKSSVEMLASDPWPAAMSSTHMVPEAALGARPRRAHGEKYASCCHEADDRDNRRFGEEVVVRFRERRRRRAGFLVRIGVCGFD